MDGLLMVWFDIISVHIHENVAYMGQRQLKPKPLTLYLWEKLWCLSILNESSNGLKVVCLEICKALIEVMTVFMKDHVVGEAVELLKGEIEGVSIIDFNNS